jgi:hypothetical protein
MEEMKPREPDLVQRVMGPGGLDETAAYVVASQDEFRDCLKTVFLSIARMAFQQAGDIADKLIPETIKCYEKYFQSMKGQINLSEQDMESLINEEINRQQNFYLALQELSSRFSVEGVKFDVLSPGDVYCEPAWDTELTIGTTIRTDSGVYLFSIPLVSAYTSDFMALRQEPVAAGILGVTGDYIMFFPVNQDPEEKFADACLKIFGTPEDITADIEGARQAYIISGFILVDGEKSFSPAEIEELKKKYSVLAIVTANSSNFTAVIHVEEDRGLSRLLEEIGRKGTY